MAWADDEGTGMGGDTILARPEMNETRWIVGGGTGKGDGENGESERRSGGWLSGKEKEEEGETLIQFVKTKKKSGQITEGTAPNPAKQEKHNAVTCKHAQTKASWGLS